MIRASASPHNWSVVEHLSKLISKKQIVVIGTGWALLEAQDFETKIVIASVAVVYMVIDAVKQIIEIVRTKT